MILRRTIGSRHFRDLLKLQKPNIISLSSPKSDELLFLPSLPCRSFSRWAQFEKKSDETIQKRAEPLSVLFRREFSASERADNGGAAAESRETTKVSEKLRVLEEVVRGLNEERVENGKSPRLLPAERIDSNERRGAKVNLIALFSGKEKKKVKSVKPSDFGNEDPAVYKELSPDMRMFAYHLYTEGYLKYAKFVTKSGEFDVTCFEFSYARDFLKYAANKFGQDHQGIAKWLSARDLKKVALFGCPTIERNSVSAARRMRKFFDIEEEKVCGECTLKESCKYANKKLKGKFTHLKLGKVTRLLIVYAMESYPQELVVPEEIKDCVGRLLKEIVKLSQTTS